MTKAITVLLAEDHTVVREGLRSLLKDEENLHVIGEADNGRKTVEMVKRLRPMVVVMDIAMPQLNGLEAASQILKLMPATRILILSAHSDDAYIQHFNQVGAAGYLVKQTSSHILAKAIREVAKGKPFFSPSITNRFDDKKYMSRRVATKQKQVAHLTSRQREVIQLIAEGETNKRIAVELGISLKTVEKHRQNLMVRLKIHDTAGLTRYAVGAGIIESSVQLTIVHPGNKEQEYVAHFPERSITFRPKTK